MQDILHALLVSIIIVEHDLFYVEITCVVSLLVSM